MKEVVYIATKDGEDLIEEKALVFLDEGKCIEFCQENTDYGWSRATLMR